MRDTKPDIRAFAAAVAGIGIAALSLLPIANWIPEGHETPWYSAVADGWLGGSLLVVGIGLVLAIASRRVPELWREGWTAGLSGRWDAAPTLVAASIAAVALIAYCLIARLVFHGRPGMIDEVAMVMHARAFADGALTWTSNAHPEFFSSLNIIDTGGRSFSHFPAGGPAMLAIGILLGGAWLAVPLSGAIAVFVFASMVRRMEPRPGVSLAATLLFAFAPFMAFMSGSHMNHVPMMMWVLVGVAALLRVTGSSTPVPWPALVSGFGFGAAATIRPADSLAFALPAAIWYLALAVRDRRRWTDAIASAIGVAIPVAALMWVNSRTTGAPLRFGYEMLWGSGVGLGFHPAPWGDPHTPMRGLELLNVYFLDLATVLYETPVPAVLPAIAALALTRRLAAVDRYLLVSGALLVGLYFMYWFNGSQLGPRYFIPLLPVFAIWTARFFPAVRERLGDGLPYRAMVYGSVAAITVAVTMAIPARARVYAGSGWAKESDIGTAAAAAGVTNALVLVRETWTAQRLARLWGRDLTRTDARRLQLLVDRCVLDHRLTALEREDVRGAAALDALTPLLRDSARVVRVTVSGYRTEARLPDLEYTEQCNARIADDRGGTANLNALLLTDAGNNIWARDLHARDTLLLRQYPDRPVYLLRSEPVNRQAFQLIPLSRDSLWAAWTGHASP
jgi:hypothetical protein